jgi:hypothetical protein
MAALSAFSLPWADAMPATDVVDIIAIASQTA